MTLQAHRDASIQIMTLAYEQLPDDNDTYVSKHFEVIRNKQVFNKYFVRLLVVHNTIHNV